ncbi:hypothetical protein ABZ865_11295 [Streptomyces sp. NPDC047085]|uniref:hypothetical protein n=1 Tax=Streptomyces sp. NPDC047085 TaxID=3155140 RepID=UPI0033FCD035
MAIDVVHLLNEIGVVKKEVKRLSDAVPGLKADIDGLKVAVSAATLSAQLFKFDWSVVKLDEKGITVNGLQKVKWSWIEKDEEKKKEKAKKEKEEDEEKLKRNLADLFLAKSKDADIGEAQETANKASREIRELKTALRKVGQETSTQIGNKDRPEIAKVRNSVRSLTQALAGI